MPRGHEIERNYQPIPTRTEALATTHGGMFTLAIESGDEGSNRVELHISVDLWNDGISLGFEWLRKVVATLVEHLETAGRDAEVGPQEDAFRARLSLLDEELAGDEDV